MPLVNRLTAPGGVDTSDTCFVKNCTSASCSHWSPRSYCCPETSAKQDFSDESSVELHPKCCQYCRRPSRARLDPHFTQKFGGGKIIVWGYIQYGGAREICKVDGNIDSAKYQQILASQYIPNYKRRQILPKGWSSLPYLRYHYEVSQEEEDQDPSGMASTVSRYEYY